MTDPYYRPNPPSHVPAALVRDFNINNVPDGDLDVFQTIHRMHGSGISDVFWTRNNGGHWVALRAQQIAEVASDWKRFSSKRMLVPDEQNFDTDFFVPLMADPPEHALYRGTVAAFFQPNRINAVEGEIRRFTETLVDELQVRGECEFMSEFALQMPVISFLGLLELPAEDRKPLLSIAEAIVRPPRSEDTRENALQRVFDYLSPILTARRAAPGDDVISKIVTSNIGGRPLTSDEMLGLTATILIGGLDTVAATLGFVAQFLAEDAGARHFLNTNPTRIVACIDELFRRFAPATHGRVVTADECFCGVNLKKGDHIVWADAMFNLDPRLYAEPMKVDFERKRQQHLTFGNGVHYCLGAFLARTQMRLFIQTWLQRIPDFRLDSDAIFRPGMTFAYSELRLRWRIPQGRHP